MKKLLILLVVVIAAACSNKNSPAPSIPADWYGGDKTNLTQPEVKPESKSVDQILEATRLGLEALPVSQSEAKIGNWEMPFVLSELGITTTGIIGTVVTKSVPTYILAWGDTTRLSRDARDPAFDNLENTLTYSGVVTDDTIEKDVSRMAKILVSTGHVKDFETLKENLKKAVRQFVDTVGAIPQKADCPWYVSRVRTDLSVEFSGVVNAMYTAGGDARLRLEWFRTEAKANPVVRKEESSLTEDQKYNIKQFVSAMSEDLEALLDKDIYDPVFKPASFRVGLGMNAKGDAGFAKVAGGFVSHIYFNRSAKVARTENSPVDENYMFSILDSQPNVEGKDPLKVVKVARDTIRKSLKRAIKMAHFVSDSAAKLKINRWQIYDVKVGYDLNLGGDLNLVTLTGTIASEIIMHNSLY